MSDPRRRPYAESARGARLGARSPRHYLPGLLVQAPQRRPSGGGGIPPQDPGLAPGSSATPQSPVGAHPPEDLGALQRRPLGRDALSAVVPPETLSPSSSAPSPGRDAPRPRYLLGSGPSWGPVPRFLRGASPAGTLSHPSSSRCTPPQAPQRLPRPWGRDPLCMPHTTALRPRHLHRWTPAPPRSGEGAQSPLPGSRMRSLARRYSFFLARSRVDFFAEPEADPSPESTRRTQPGSPSLPPGAALNFPVTRVPPRLGGRRKRRDDRELIHYRA